MLHYREAEAVRHPYIDYHMEEKDVGTWYIRIRNLEGDEGEFIGGEYLVRLVAQADYPFSAPKFYFMTPNGVYSVEQECCIGTGHYHKEKYAAGSQKIHGFAREIVNGLLGWRTLGGGIGLLQTKTAEKKLLAARSRPHNLRLRGDLVTLFDQHPYNQLDRFVTGCRLHPSADMTVRRMLRLEEIPRP